MFSTIQIIQTQLFLKSMRYRKTNIFKTFFHLSEFCSSINPMAIFSTHIVFMVFYHQDRVSKNKLLEQSCEYVLFFYNKYFLFILSYFTNHLCLLLLCHMPCTKIKIIKFYMFEVHCSHNLWLHQLAEVCNLFLFKMHQAKIYNKKN